MLRVEVLRTRNRTRMPLVCTVISMLTLAVFGALGSISWLIESTSLTIPVTPTTSDYSWATWVMGTFWGLITVYASVVGGTHLHRRREPPVHDDEAQAIASGFQRIMVQQHPEYSHNGRTGKKA